MSDSFMDLSDIGSEFGDGTNRLNKYELAKDRIRHFFNDNKPSNLKP